MDVTIFDSTVEIDESAIAEPPAEIRTQVREYERGDRRCFELTVAHSDGVAGEIMAAMTEIPYGETRSYGELAATLETSPIVVGRACARNPVPLIVPCHRVVGADGDLRGYAAADGVATKRRLLELESREPAQTRLSAE